MSYLQTPENDLTFATMDVALPETSVEELRTLDIDALMRCRKSSQRVVDAYVASDWFPSAIEAARARVELFDTLIAERRLEFDEQTLYCYETGPDVDVDTSHDAEAAAARAALASFLRPGDLIVDAGCGFGGNAAAFIRAGFRVFAFDGVPSVAQRASQLHDIEALNLRFDQFRPQYCGHIYDAVFAHAALGHVPRAGLAAVMKRLTAGLRPRGAFYASFPAGDGESRRQNGILETHLGEDEIIRLFVAAGLEPLRLWKSGGDGEDGTSIMLNVVAVARQ